MPLVWYTGTSTSTILAHFLNGKYANVSLESTTEHYTKYMGLEMKRVKQWMIHKHFPYSSL